MSILGGYVRLNRVLGGTIRRLQAIDEAAQALEDRKPLGSAEVEIAIVGPDGKPIGGGVPGAQFAAGSVGPGLSGFPSGQPGTGMPDLTGTSARLGGKTKTGESAGGSQGIKDTASRRDTLAAIIEEAGVVPPERAQWPPQGYPGKPPGFMVETVLALGTSAPVDFLIWVAGLLAYTSVDSASSTASRHGGGFRPGKKSRFREFVLEGGQASGLHFVDPTNRTGILDSRLDPTRSQGQLTTGPTSQGISSAQAKSIDKNTQTTATATTQLVTAVKELTATVRAGQSGLSTRAGGYV